MPVNEFDLIDLISARCAGSRADVRIGIGDDAAVVGMPPAHELVVCTDTLVAGVHFPHGTAAFDIGWKSLAVNLSDIAAMGATPAWATLALTLPTADRDFVAAFADGFAGLAGLYHLALIGGDTTSGPLSITVTALGFSAPDRALRRDGARVGDAVYVTGTLGDAAAGLRLLNASHPAGDSEREARGYLLERLNRPQPRVAAGAFLRDVASSCIDVSDGLLADLGHVAARSGVGIEIDIDRLPASNALLLLISSDARSALQMTGGDDYELAFTANVADESTMLQDLARIGEVAVRIGRVVEGSGVRVFDAHGTAVDTARRGWEHFA